MTEFIGKIIVGCFWCYGIWKLFDDLLLPVRVKIEEWIGMKWSKPLVNCPPCMGSFHGLILGLIFFGQNPLVIIIYCVSLCGLNYLVQQFLPEYD